MVIGQLWSLAQVETKGGKNIQNFDAQLKSFQDYLHQNHSSFVDGLEFLPFLAKKEPLKKSYGKEAGFQKQTKICKKYQIDIDSSAEDFDAWWNDCPELMGKAEEPVKENYEKLVSRLLEMSALTLTSVVDCSSQISDSHLKLLR